jgi:hypothetical protein
MLLNFSLLLFKSLSYDSHVNCRALLGLGWHTQATMCLAFSPQWQPARQWGS